MSGSDYTRFVQALSDNSLMSLIETLHDDIDDGVAHSGVLLRICQTEIRARNYVTLEELSKEDVVLREFLASNEEENEELTEDHLGHLIDPMSAAWLALPFSFSSTRSAEEQ